MRGASVVVLVIAIVMGGFAALLARDWLNNHSQANVIVAEPTSTIVVANGPIAFGAALSTDNIHEISWPTRTLPDGSFKSVADLLKDGRRLVLSPFVKNEPIVRSKVGAPNQAASLSTMISEGKRAVTVSVDEVRGVAGFVSPGDFVDVVLTRAKGGMGSVSETILQHVKVLAIDQLAEQRQEKPVVARAVTFELSAEEALKITLATNVGRLSLILRKAAEEIDSPDRRVTEQDLFTGDIGLTSAPAPSPQASPAVEKEPRPAPTSNMRKVAVFRSLKGEEYEVPHD